MFEDLSQRLEGVFKKFRGRGVLTEDNIKEGLREVRRALLEADVNYKVAEDFVKNVQERAAGQEVLKGLNPGQQVVKVVHDEMVGLLGGKLEPLAKASTGTTVVMATHDHAIVDAMRRRVIQLEAGRVVRDQSRGVYEGRRTGEQPIVPPQQPPPPAEEPDEPPAAVGE